ncbi:lipocalin family protein [Flexithrix dorotheae]|uniref:lipocalin family protein n=1 Tax=Flexithrix dorotheae TaxID=70993 RepID=UPI000376FA10|nr:DUF5004 domain-containing protein [Flexithrix dorotheae]
MNLLKRYNLILFIQIAVSLFSCKEDPNPNLTDAQKISKRWGIQSVKINGFEDPNFSGSDFSITFNSDSEGKASTYSIVQGSVPRPDAPFQGTDGTWKLTTTAIVYNETSNEAASNTILELSENILIISFTVPEELDKTIPTYEYTLSPK